jgi:hypothetical protein
MTFSKLPEFLAAFSSTMVRINFACTSPMNYIFFDDNNNFSEVYIPNFSCWKIMTVLLQFLIDSKSYISQTLHISTITCQSFKEFTFVERENDAF